MVQVQVPVFSTCQVFVKAVPAEMLVPSGMVTSLPNAALSVQSRDGDGVGDDETDATEVGSSVAWEDTGVEVCLTQEVRITSATSRVITFFIVTPYHIAKARSSTNNSLSGFVSC